jgi:uncharacterized protein YecT (DUF1311 family)
MFRLTFVRMMAILAAGIPATAQHMDVQDLPCPTAVTTLDMRTCFAKANDTADAQLNGLYKEIRPKLGTADEKRLVTTQGLWIQYRDAHCTATRELYAGGSLAPVMFLACSQAMTKARTKELAAAYDRWLK